MINLRILVPDATENYIKNPQFRYATTGWTAVGATLTRTLDQARFGIASGKVVTNGAALAEGSYYRVSDLNGISDAITSSIYLRGSVGDEKIRLRLQDDPTGQEWVSSVVQLRTDRWTRVDVSGNCTGGNDIRLKVETGDTVARAYTFYIDGAQMERKTYCTTYCDGDQSGCRWNIINSNSHSIRESNTREGGRWVALAGPCRPDNDIYATVLGGFGDPPLQNNKQSWSLSPGSYFQNQKVLERVMTVTMTVKKEDLRPSGPPSLRNIHELRQQLIDIFKNDKTLGDQAFLLEYSEDAGDKKLYIRARYDGGLEGSWDVRNGWFNTFTIRLIAVDPFWAEDSQDVLQLSRSQSLSSTGTIATWLKKTTGEIIPTTYSNGTYINGAVTFALAPDGTVYAGGNFPLPAGPFQLVSYDGSSWSVIATANDIINGLSVAPDGSLYVVGYFTSIGGIAANRVAKYVPSTGVWSALGVGVGVNPECVFAASNGQVYVGGSFTTAGGINCFRIARWDGLQWRTVGATSGYGNNSVYGIAQSLDKTKLYVVGSYTTNQGGTITYNRVSQVDLSTNLISDMGYGVNGIVKVVKVGLAGEVYIGGDFTASGAPSADPLLRVAKWNGAQLFLPLGDGFDTASDASSVYALEIGPLGQLFAGGDFLRSGSKYMYKMAVWYGGAWSSFEFYAPLGGIGNGYFNPILQHPNGQLHFGIYAGGGAAMSVNFPANNVVTNHGTAATWPLLYMLGQGRIRFISNLNSLQSIFVDTTIYAGEEMFIDFARGKIYSTVRGDLSFTLLPGSEIRTMYLIPGDNKFLILVAEDVNAIVQLRWPLQHWSADAVIDAEDMQ